MALPVRPAVKIMKEKLFRLSLNLFLLISVAIILGACAAPLKKRDYPVGYHERGLASWYGKDFHGRPTSSGEIYNMFDLTAAHKTLPLGATLRVTEIESGRVVRVKVNDRGPFVGNRILDLSFAAAQALGMVGVGIAKIEFEIIGYQPIKRGGKNGFLVQVGSYQIRENALRMKEKVAAHHRPVFIEPYESNQGALYRVRIGPFLSEEKAQRIAEEIPSQIAAEETIVPVVIRAE
jgi:rare lipoprotein A